MEDWRRPGGAGPLFCDHQAVGLGDQTQPIKLQVQQYIELRGPYPDGQYSVRLYSRKWASGWYPSTDELVIQHRGMCTDAHRQLHRWDPQDLVFWIADRPYWDGSRHNCRRCYYRAHRRAARLLTLLKIERGSQPYLIGFSHVPWWTTTRCESCIAWTPTGRPHAEDECRRVLQFDIQVRLSDRIFTSLVHHLGRDAVRHPLLAVKET